MRLNLPFIPEFEQNRFLVVGAGGGFDTYTGIPIAHELHQRDAILRFLSFGNNPNTFSDDVLDATLPERFKTKKEEKSTVHFLKRMGVKPYRSFIRDMMHLFDVVILCDGGIDSLMRGNEQNPGTLLEDSVSLSVFDKLDIPVILACLGMTTEKEEDLCHYHALENISNLCREDAFLGSCSLTKTMPGYKEYKEICELGWHEGNRISHIQSRVIKATEGEFGTPKHENIDARINNPTKQLPFISPLMPIYWFFDAHKVAANNLLTPVLEPTTTWTDVVMIYRQHLNENLVTRKTKDFIL